MAIRRESVQLILDDRFSTPAIRAAASARLLQESLDNTSTSAGNTSPALSRVERAVDATGATSRRSGPEIDRFSGRLRLLTDLLITVGPAAAPIAAVAVPAIIGLSGALGAAALAAGVAVGAFQGVGAAVEALGKAELEPTAENLQAAREALEDLSPAAASFAVQVRELVPALKDIRDSAAEGMFPGMSEGIDELERRLPIIERISGLVGEALGGLAADGGASIASGRWGPFLRFIEDEAPAAVTALGHVVGDLSHGVAEMFMAFDPLSDGVIASLERGAQAFDEWSTGLSGSEDFEAFMDYVETSGPLVADAVGSIANAIVQISKALGPLGQTSLKGITELADGIAAVAGSDFGGPLLTAVAAFAVYNRAAGLATAATTRFSGGLSGLSRGGVIGGIIFALYALGEAGHSLQESFDDAAPTVQELTSALLDAGGNGSTAVIAGQLGDLGAAVDKLDGDGVTEFATGLNKAAQEGGVLGQTLKALEFTPLRLTDPVEGRKLREAAANIEAIDQALAGLVTSASPERAQQAFQELADSQGLTADQTAELMELLPGYTEALAGVANEAQIAAEGVDGAAEATQRFSEALAAMNGWLDKRAALRGYRDDLAELAKGLKDGFNRKDVEQIDQTAASITKVAASIKDKGLREDFLQGARASLAELSDRSGPKARGEIDKVIAKLDEFGLTKPNAPHLTVDAEAAKRHVNAVVAEMRGVKDKNVTVDADTGKAQRDLRGTASLTEALGRQDPTINVFADTNAAQRALAAINAIRLDDKYVTVITRHTNVNVAEVSKAKKEADGGSVPKGGVYADRYLYMLAPGEEVISNRHGQADQFRSDRAAGRIPGYAEGGETGKRTGAARARRKVNDALEGLGVNLNVDTEGASHALDSFGADLDNLRGLFKDAHLKFNAGLKKQTKALSESAGKFDGLNATLATLQADRAAYAGAAGSSIQGASLTGNGLAGFEAGVAANTADYQTANAGLATAIVNGLDGALLDFLGTSGDVSLLSQFGGLNAEQIAQQEGNYNALLAAQSQFGNTAASAKYDAQIAAQTSAVGAMAADIRRLEKSLPDAVRRGAQEGTESGSHRGTRDGQSQANQNANTAATQNQRGNGRGGGHRGNGGGGNGNGRPRR